MRNLFTALALLLAFAPSAARAAKTPKPDKPNPQQVEQFTRLQIFLDNANFGPGRLDGRDGLFTRKALALYRAAQGNAPAAPVDPKAPLDLSDVDLKGTDPVFIEYTITKEDVETVGKLPSGPEAESKVKWLPYASLAEAIGEKFHSEVKFIKELNPNADKLKEGDKVKVPNVKPFELWSVKTLKPGAEAAAVVANELGEGGDQAGDTQPAKDAAGDPAPAITVKVSIKENMLEVHAGEKTVAAFPVTVGAHQTESPVGNWTVKAVAKLPTFRWDLAMLKHGERSSHFHMLPPGPNNPVGVMWIALNKKGIGLHGTDDPDSIGRAASHGCVRLANWDVVKLAGLVKPGTPVSIE